MQDELIFIDDQPPEIPKHGEDRRWVVIVADDDADTQAVTRMALGLFLFEGRALRLVPCRSEAATCEALVAHPDAAVLLLDVVMEHEDSGLRLVHHVRDLRQDGTLSIVVRTAAGGYPEVERAIRASAVDAFYYKSSLDKPALCSAMGAALALHQRRSRAHRRPAPH